jgi:hypothetical protein
VTSPYHPDELQSLLLHAALSGDEYADEAWARAKHVAQTPQLLDHASYRLLPQLYRNLLDAGVAEPQLAKLKGIYRHSWYSNQRLFHQSADLLRELHDAGIETLVLKGAALSILHYRDAGSRPMEDFDVLVHRSDAARTAALLEAAGWQQVNTAWPTETMFRVVSSVGFKHARGSEVDLHWNPLYEVVPEDPFWQHAVPLEIGGVSTLALDPTDQLMHVCVHGLSWFPAPLRWISDAVVVARSQDPGVDWERLAEQATRWHLSARMETALELLQKSFGVPVPDATLERLRRSRRPLSERIGHRVLTRPPEHFVLPAVFWDRYCRMRNVRESGYEWRGLPLTRFPRYAFHSLRAPSRREALLKAAGGSLPGTHPPEVDD